MVTFKVLEGVIIRQEHILLREGTPMRAGV